MLSTRAYTRLTLALDIVRKLDTGPYAGYHELGIVKHQIDLYDTISIVEADATSISCDNPLVPRDKTNICWKAVDLVKRKRGIVRNAAIVIQKNIPVMGGLAGGSADAAAMLLMLNAFWDLRLDRRELHGFGRDLGMDVPFFFTGGTVFDTESTAVLDPIETSVTFDFVLVIPDFGISTREAYQTIDHSRIGGHQLMTSRMIEALRAGDPDGAVRFLHNDFESTAFARFPRLASIKQLLLKAGCAGAVMSGSGSTVVGIARSADHALEVKNTISAGEGIAEVRVCRTLELLDK